MTQSSLFTDTRRRAQERLGRFPAGDPKVSALDALMDAEREIERLCTALGGILDAAERAHMGFPIESEEWYARRDFARISLRPVNE